MCNKEHKKEKNKKDKLSSRDYSGDITQKYVIVANFNKIAKIFHFNQKKNVAAANKGDFQ